MKRDQPERRIQLTILKYLKMKGYDAGKIKSTGARRGKYFILDPYQFNGIADIMVFTPALSFIEVKAGRNKQSPDQIAFQNLCNKATVPYHVVYSLDDVIRLFP